MTEKNEGSRQAGGSLSDIDAKVEALRAEHGAVVVIDTPRGKLVFKPPHHADYERFIDRLTADKGSKITAARELCQMCVVHPTQDEAREIFKRLPAIPQNIAVALGELVGSELEAVVLKT